MLAGSLLNVYIVGAQARLILPCKNKNRTELAIICQWVHMKRLVSRNEQNDPTGQVVKNRKKEKTTVVYPFKWNTVVWQKH